MVAVFSGLEGCSVAGRKVVSGNPIFGGWYADPHAVVYGKTCWVFPTYSARYSEQTFLDAFSSRDLVNWTKHERIIDTNSVKWADSCMWAPAHIEKDGKYYLFFGANDAQEGHPGGIGVAVANSPEGPYEDLLGRPLISENVNGAQPIDQFVWEENGEYLMYYGGWRHCNMVRLKPDFSGLLPFDDGSFYREITPERYVEGAFMLKRGGKYYFMWSEGGWGGANYCVAYAMADSPMGPFERIGKILEQDPEVATSAGHHSVINVPGTDEWYIFYHRRPLGDRARDHRATCIEKLEFTSDGLIVPVKLTFEGVGRRRL
ncbi:MAG: glycoside hydrolase family 43 protein [Alistipes sp.]|nr:glycoside hydrolase family 43 protein [Alistipes sp.]